jgi:peptidoglycan/LPS O-acetylase OafA/YrhL
MVYRPDIDGLRAIAVMAVVWHHLLPQTLPGGFVGVDIFFVISGYLITSQMLVLKQKGQWRVTDFYNRRIHRILPALWGVCAASLLLGGAIMSPNDWVKVAHSVVSAALGWSNIFFWREYGNYFLGNAAEAPLLHTWSLGVEEQFYVVWPLLLLGLLKLNKRLAAVLLVFMVMLGIVFSQWALGRYASASYYLLPTRFFELAFGGGLSWLLWTQRLQLPSPRVAGWLALLGMTGLVYSMVQIHPGSDFPGFNALIPCAAVFLLIWAGTQSYWCKGWLQTTLLVFVGKISYSLYLWHWPLIAWANYLYIDLTGWSLFWIATLSLLLAYGSWRWIEQPFRQLGLHTTLQQSLAKYVVPAGGFLLAACAWIIFQAGLPARFDERVSQYEWAIQQRPELLRAGCHVPSALFAQLPNPAACMLGEPQTNPAAVLWGDSYANHFSGLVDEMAKHQGLAVVDYSMDACPPLLGYSIEGNALYEQRCVQRNEQMLEFLKSKSVSRAILASNWPDNPQAAQAFQHTVKELQLMGLAVTVIHANQLMQKSPGCAIRQAMGKHSKPCSVAQEPPPAYLQSSELQRFGAHSIEPNQLICNAGNCSPTLGNVMLYRDKGHLNDVGARALGQRFVQTNQKL